MDTIYEDKKNDYYRAIRAATSYPNQILELYDNIEEMLISLNHFPGFEKEEMLMEMKAENEAWKGLIPE